MPRINPVTESNTPARSKPLIEGVRKGLGLVPNIMATMAHSPAALQAYLGFGQALGGGKLSGALREQIAVAVAGENSCGYCASAHTALGKKSGVQADELARNLRGESADPRTQAALDFARTVVIKRGHIADADLSAVRQAGYGDDEVIEIIAVVAINIFTNYFNHIADTAIDFPKVAVPEPASV
jgi:uncharacterized peroxidase-related enzyme